MSSSPVSASISSSQTWLPLGKVKSAGAKVPVSNSPPSRPGGRVAARKAARAASVSVMRRSVPATAKLPVGELDVGLGRFQQVGGDLLRLGDDLVGRHPQGRAADHGRARAAGADAERDPVGVAVDILDVAGVEAELFGQDLLEGRLVALALVLGAHEESSDCRSGESGSRRIPGPVRPPSRSGWRGRCRATCRAAATSARRAGNPSQSANASARSWLARKSPQS